MVEEGDHIDDLATPYVLGALEPEEVERVEFHLLQCDTCRALVESERQIAHLLPFLAEPQPVPLRARQRLFRSIERPSEVAREPALEPPPRRIPVALTRLGWAAAGMAAVFALVFAWNSFQMQQQVETKDTQLSVLEERQRQIIELIGSPRGFVTNLQATGVAPGAKGGVILDPTRNAALLVVEGMPRPETGHAYVVWMVKASRHMNVGVLPVDDQGHGTLLLTPPEALASFDAIVVTEESEARVANPNGVRLMTAQVND